MVTQYVQPFTRICTGLIPRISSSRTSCTAIATLVSTAPVGASVMEIPSASPALETAAVASVTAVTHDTLSCCVASRHSVAPLATFLRI